MSDEEELPLQEMASSVGLKTSGPSTLTDFVSAFIELAWGTVRETPNWKGVSVILLGV